MSDLDDLYQEVILDHSRKPQNFFKMADADRFADGANPLCGDQITVYLKMNGDRIQETSFLGNGCAISKASASMMTAALKGKTRTEAEELFQNFHKMVTGTADSSVKPESLGKLAAFSGVSDYPVRVKCASLAWHTFRAALEHPGEKVTTE